MQREFIFKIYVTDTLKMLCMHSAKQLQLNLELDRYYDVIFPKPEEQRTADQIIEHIRAELRGGEDNKPS